MYRSFSYKGWYCAFDSLGCIFFLFPPQEMALPVLFRYPKTECFTPDQCREFIDSY